jgi:chromosome segregation ATPase
VAVHKIFDNEVTELVAPTSFECKWLEEYAIPIANKNEILSFAQKVEKLRKASGGVQKYLGDMQERVKFIERTIQVAPEVKLELVAELKSIKENIHKVSTELYGDATLTSREFEAPNSISENVGTIVWNMWNARTDVTQTNRDLYQDAGTRLEKVLVQMKDVDSKIKVIENQLDQLKTPYTPGRFDIPDWKME